MRCCPRCGIPFGEDSGPRLPIPFASSKPSEIRINGLTLRWTLLFLVPSVVAFTSAPSAATSQEAILRGIIAAIPFALLVGFHYAAWSHRVAYGLFAFASSIVVVFIAAFVGCMFSLPI